MFMVVYLTGGGGGENESECWRAEIIAPLNTKHTQKLCPY